MKPCEKHPSYGFGGTIGRSEYMFGVGRGKLPNREIKRRDRICKQEGGYGFTCVNLPGDGWKSWFSGPNYGSPHDQTLADRVLARVYPSENNQR